MKKGQVVKFPLGSSENMDDETSLTLTQVVREGMTDVIVIGFDSEGDLTIVTPPSMDNARAHYLIVKTANTLVDADYEYDIEDYDEDGETDGT